MSKLYDAKSRNRMVSAAREVEHAKRMHAERVIQQMRKWLKTQQAIVDGSSTYWNSEREAVYTMALSELTRLRREKK